MIECHLEALMKRDIKQVIDKMVQLLVTQYSPKMIILFGSFAGGIPHQDSDIDLLIIKETEERFIDRWCTVHNILTGTHRSIPLDTLILTPQELDYRIARGDQFISNIIESGQLLYAA